MLCVTQPSSIRIMGTCDSWHCRKPFFAPAVCSALLAWIHKHIDLSCRLSGPCSLSSTSALFHSKKKKARVRKKSSRDVVHMQNQRFCYDRLSRHSILSRIVHCTLVCALMLFCPHGNQQQQCDRISLLVLLYNLDAGMSLFLLHQLVTFVFTCHRQACHTIVLNIFWWRLFVHLSISLCHTHVNVIKPGKQYISLSVLQ